MCMVPFVAPNWEIGAHTRTHFLCLLLLVGIGAWLSGGAPGLCFFSELMFGFTVRTNLRCGRLACEGWERKVQDGGRGMGWGKREDDLFRGRWWGGGGIKVELWSGREGIVEFYFFRLSYIKIMGF